MKLEHITPERLEAAASYLWHPNDAIAGRAKRYSETYMCHAVEWNWERITGYRAGDCAQEEFYWLLVLHGVRTDGSLKYINAHGALASGYQNEFESCDAERQSVRFMFMHMLAHWLRDE